MSGGIEPLKLLTNDTLELMMPRKASMRPRMAAVRAFMTVDR